MAEIETKNFDLGEIELKADDASGSFSGLGSVFGGRPDDKGDIIQYGAFADSLKEGGRNGNGIAMLWQHDTHSPVGVWDEVAELKKGLRVKGRFAMKTIAGREAYETTKFGAVKGLSIGFKADDWEDSPNWKGARLLKKVELWEVSLVTFGAHKKALIMDIKSGLGIKGAKTEREMEQALRDVGASKKEAQYLVTLCKGNLLREAEEVAVDYERAIDELLQALH